MNAWVPRMEGSIPSPQVPAVGEMTGRFILTFEEGAVSEAGSVLDEIAGIQAFGAGGAEASEAAEVEGGAAVVFRDLGVALVDAPQAHVEALDASIGQTKGVQHLEPERVVYALDPTLSPEYLRGFAAASRHLAGLAKAGASPETRQQQKFDESQFTWGLQATGVASSSLSGEGVVVAVLDTGIDQGHPDFHNRSVFGESHVAGASVQDGHGHGTHCAGVACGSFEPPPGPRYGIAGAAQIAVHKVLSDTGRGTDGSILAGLNAALQAHSCVISMSLGAPVAPGQAPSVAYETAARRALAQGAVIVAAAGNDSDRANGVVRPVSHPANCPSVLAVAAVDTDGQVAPFSIGGSDPALGQIDIAGPGVDIYSSLPMPGAHGRLSGTSMATPHVAGILALLRQANPELTALELITLLTRGARRLAAPSADVGAGLVQAPQ